MLLHPDCEQKVLSIGEGESLRRGFLDIFRATINDCLQQDLPSGTLIIPFYDGDSNLKPGDWAAELHLVVRQVESVDETDNADPNVHPAAHPEAEEGRGS